jgi:phosphoribosylamine--glycine ligase
VKTALVLGSGGREHALAWKLSGSPGVSRVIVAPGNDGLPAQFERWPGALRPEVFPQLARQARERGVALVVVGPDAALADGAADVFAEHGVPCFGPKRGAARIESSKAFAKEIMQAAGVPTAHYFTAASAREAETILEALPWQPGKGWVIKADGLALGKGVRVCPTLEEALQASRELVAISGQLVIEEQLFGQELSWMAFCQGEEVRLLEPARDFKRIRDDDQGPNTGGMGAYSPVPGVPENAADEVRRRIFEPTLRELCRRGVPFSGLLYAGLMWDPGTGTFHVIEFNSRFGDPEAQVLLPRFQGDFFEWCLAVAEGRLGAMPRRVPFTREAAVVVIAAAAGYPEKPPERGRAIEGLPRADGSSSTESAAPEFFFAGVERAAGGRLETAGGRVLGAMGYGSTLEQARLAAYRRLGQIRFEGMQFRRDIARGAVAPGASGGSGR